MRRDVRAPRCRGRRARPRPRPASSGRCCPPRRPRRRPRPAASPDTRSSPRGGRRRRPSAQSVCRRRGGRARGASAPARAAPPRRSAVRPRRPGSDPRCASARRRPKRPSACDNTAAHAATPRVKPEEEQVKRWVILAVVAALAAASVLVGGRASAAPRASGLGACLVTDIGGLNDKSFNHDAYLGLLEAEKTLHIKGRVIQSKSPSDYIPNLQACVRSHAGITIAVGFLMTDAIDAVGVATLKHHPKSVLGLIFKEQQAGYLVGYGAGLWAKQHGGKAVGSVGGLKIPPVDRYIAGFQFGAKKADPGIQTLNDYSQDFVAQAKCKEKALNQIAQGSVVEFQVAGQCGLGVLDAAHEKGVFGIGVDADQGYLGPWVMTSALKRVDVAVYNAIKAAQAGKLAGGTNKEFGADIGGVGYGKWSPRVPKSIQTAVAAQFKLLKAGKIKGIPTTVK